MTKEQMLVFQTRVSRANRSELVVITYDIAIEYFNEAKEYFKKGDYDNFIACCKAVKKCFTDLLESLDYEYALSLDLQKLYLFLNNSMFQSIIKKEMINFEIVGEIMMKLRDSFVIIAKEDNSESVMQNTQQIYAGYTYGKGVLNEVVRR